MALKATLRAVLYALKFQRQLHGPFSIFIFIARRNTTLSVPPKLSLAPQDAKIRAQSRWDERSAYPFPQRQLPGRPKWCPVFPWGWPKSRLEIWLLVRFL